MMVILKVLAAFVVLGVLGATAWLVADLKERVVEPQLKEPVATDQLPVIDPGALAFEKATELLATSQFEEARRQLRLIVGTYPGSKASVEARRILGEINLDELLSRDQLDGKQVHTVKRGESYTVIARKYETTMDCIMHMNNMQRLEALHPGDELVMLPLRFNVKIDVEHQQLSLMNEGHFLKSYPLVRVKSRAKLKGTIRSKVDQKFGLSSRGNKVSPTAPDSYRPSKKVLILAHHNLRIRQDSEADEEDPGSGFFVSPSDMEELALLLRVGNEVEVRF